MRLGDLDALFCQFWGKADPFKEQTLVRPCVVWSDAATMAREAPTIDPETLPIVRQLREELAEATAEREAAVEGLENYMVQNVINGNAPCEICANARETPCEGCDPKWRGPQKEATP